MELTIEQSCPSCGAPIVLQEDDKLVHCDYCDVRNYKVAGDGQRFVLPVKIDGRSRDKELFYVPYLRFKGSIYYVRGEKVQYKIVDTTRIGLKKGRLPVSLGLRPQAMQIRPVVAKTNGRFIPQTEPTRKVFVHAAKIIDLFSTKKDQQTFHRAFIGETLSCIYQPYYIDGDTLYDGVDDRPVGEKSLLDKHLAKSILSRSEWEPRFLSTLCPACGGLLGGERDAIVLQCTNCAALWQEKGGRFSALDWEVVQANGSPHRFLPFWRIVCTTGGEVLKTYGDFLRFTNQPLLIRPEYNALPLVFWVPAFKIRPKTFLRLSSQLTVAGPKIPRGRPDRVKDHHPVTLSSSEAIQTITSLLAKATLSREKKFPLLPGMKVVKPRTLLTYLPFTGQRHDLVQEHTMATLQTAAMRYGRSL